MEHHKIPKKSFDKIMLCVTQLKQENPSTASDYWCNEIFRLLQTTEKPVLTPPVNAIIHELKIHPTDFKETVEGTKNNEIRMADRPFAVGDWLLLREWNPQSKSYTGESVYKEITYITKAVFDLDRYWILSLK